MRPGKLAILVVCVLWCGLAGSQRGAWAAASGQAGGRKHARKANHLADTNKCKQAIPEFSKAIRVLKDPTLLFNRAECYRRIGESAKAVTDYRKFLVQLPAAPNRAQVEGQIAVLEKPTGRPSSGGRLAAPKAAPELPSLPVDLPRAAAADGREPSSSSPSSSSPSPSSPSSPSSPVALVTPGPPSGLAGGAALAGSPVGEARFAATPARGAMAPLSASAPAPVPPSDSTLALALDADPVASAVSGAPEPPMIAADARPADDAGAGAHSPPRWWLWVLGAVVVAGGAAGAYFVLGQGKTDIPMSPLGNYKF